MKENGRNQTVSFRFHYETEHNEYISCTQSIPEKLRQNEVFNLYTLYIITRISVLYKSVFMQRVTKNDVDSIVDFLDFFYL